MLHPGNLKIHKIQPAQRQVILTWQTQQKVLKITPVYYQANNKNYLQHISFFFTLHASNNVFPLRHKNPEDWNDKSLLYEKSYLNLYFRTSSKKLHKLVETSLWGWRDGSAVKSTDCSAGGPGFNSQQPHGGSQSSVVGSDALVQCVSEDSCSVLIKIKTK